MDSFLLPCPFKYLTGLDCPGCGFQRSIIALFQGNWQQSLEFYPPAIPFLFSAMLGVSALVFKKNTESKLLKICYVITGLIIFVSYGYKIVTHRLH